MLPLQLALLLPLPLLLRRPVCSVAFERRALSVLGSAATTADAAADDDAHTTTAAMLLPVLPAAMESEKGNVNAFYYINTLWRLA